MIYPCTLLNGDAPGLLMMILKITKQNKNDFKQIKLVLLLIE